MESKNNFFMSSDPNSFGSLWLANFGLLSRGDKPVPRASEETFMDQDHIDSQVPRTSLSLKCTECCFTSADQRMLQDHIRTSHPHKLKKMYACTMCDFSTSNRSNLTYHISKHTGERPFKCAHCEHRARSAAYLKIHVRSRHTGEKPYACPSCNFATPHSNALKSHIAAKHTGEKKYKCDLCDFSAVHSGNLKYHINSKHSEKPFKCSLCNYSAGHKGNLKTHIETKHTEDKKYKCPECDYGTGHQGNFKHHLKTSHNIERYSPSDFTRQTSTPIEGQSSPPNTSLYPYKCTQCPAFFHYPGKLVSHITEKHNFVNSDDILHGIRGDKYKCSDCAFTTDQESVLEAHRNDCHPSRTSFSCYFPNCSFSTQRESDIDIHVKTGHSLSNGNYGNLDYSKRTFLNHFNLSSHSYSQPVNQNLVSVCNMDNQKISRMKCKEGSSTFPGSSDVTAYFIYSRNKSNETFRCVSCNFSTGQLEDFHVHVWSMHPVQKPHGFKCSPCQLFALDLGALRSHMEVNHPSECHFKYVRCPELFYPHNDRKIQNNTNSPKHC